ncbi:metallophosphoesterase family protein [Liquorilactobacillus satsumensis]|uniref:metallophosphoesterase family protein n=1 Tax=Liquorilactobacillus satsumensis TaxID=259059 RepID=UPI0039E9A3A2
MNSRIAIVSDSHGNATALKAVIRDALEQKAAEFWSLGDIGFGGANSKECFELLAQQNTTQFLMGNWEASYNEVLTKKVFNINDLSDVYFVMLAKYEYEHLGSYWNQRLLKLPLTAQKQRYNRIFSLTHNLPTKNYGPALQPTQPQANFDQLTLDPKVDVALYGHTHTPIWRYTQQGQLILNPGSVGEIFFSRTRLMQNRSASYLLLTVTAEGITEVDFRRVPYDGEIELKKAAAQNFPYMELYQKNVQTGKIETHNQPLLKKINEELGYRRVAQEFITSLQSIQVDH